MTTVATLLLVFFLLLLILIIVSVNKKNKRAASLLKAQKEEIIDRYKGLLLAGIIDETQFKSKVENESTFTIPFQLNKINEEIQRGEYLLSKYDLDHSIKLFNRYYWIGMSRDELIDSLGAPNKSSEKQTKNQHVESLYFSFLKEVRRSTGNIGFEEVKMKFVLKDGIVQEFNNVQWF